MKDILLEFVFQIKTSTPIPAASTAYLRHALVLVKPKDETVESEIVRVTSPEQAAELTACEDLKSLLGAGVSYCYVLPTPTLDVADILRESPYRFFTALISSDFSAEEIAAKDFGGFSGVTGSVWYDKAQAKAFAVSERQCAFWGLPLNKGANMFTAFGNLLSRDTWKNQQYCPCPKDDGITEIGDADALFDDRVSFALHSEEFGTRLAFFVAGGQAIVAPYVKEEIKLKMQGRALTWINANEPDYTLTDAKLLEAYLNKGLEPYLAQKIITGGEVRVSLYQENFVGSAKILIPEPKALWRLFGELAQEVA